MLLLLLLLHLLLLHHEHLRSLLVDFFIVFPILSATVSALHGFHHLLLHLQVLEDSGSVCACHFFIVLGVVKGLVVVVAYHYVGSGVGFADH